MSKIYYIRHGQASVLSDNYDNLSQIGFEQSRLTGKYFANQNIQFDKIYIGPLHRHRQTYDGISEAYNPAMQRIMDQPQIMETLAEHHGPRVVKTLLPELIQENEGINQLASKPHANRNEQIANYMRVYETVTTMWVDGQLDDRVQDIQSWKAFRSMAANAFTEICKNTQKGENILVITSGGPVAVAVGEALQLTDAKTLEVSWVTANCSINVFLKNDRRISLSNMNTTPVFKDRKFYTLV